MDKPKNLEELRQRALNDDTQFLLSRQKDIMESILAPESEDERAVIAEDAFEMYFLDMFKNPNDPKYKNSPLLKKWVELADGYTKEVDIISPKGEKVLTVPALTPRPTINVDEIGKLGVGTMGAVYDAESRHNEPMAIHRMKEQAAVIGKKAVEDEDQIAQDASAKWRVIFKYFDNKHKRLEAEQKKDLEAAGEAIGNMNIPDKVSVDTNRLMSDDVEFDYDS